MPPKPLYDPGVAGIPFDNYHLNGTALCISAILAGAADALCRWALILCSLLAMLIQPGQVLRQKIKGR
jgi:hypothetical protein